MGNKKSLGAGDGLSVSFPSWRGQYLPELCNKPRCLPSFPVTEVSCYRLIGGL